MQFSNEFLNKWEHIIEEVNKTEIPLECIKKVVIRLHGKKQRTINLATLKKQGLDMDELEIVLTRTLTELGDEVKDIDFVVDVSEVAKILQPETDKLAVIKGQPTSIHLAMTASVNHRDLMKDLKERDVTPVNDEQTPDLI